MPDCCSAKSYRKMFDKGIVWNLGTPILFDLRQYSVDRMRYLSEKWSSLGALKMHF